MAAAAVAVVPMDDAAVAVVNAAAKVVASVESAQNVSNARIVVTNRTHAVQNVPKAAATALPEESAQNVNAKSLAWTTVASKMHLLNPQNWRITPIMTDHHAKGGNAATADEVVDDAVNARPMAYKNHCLCLTSRPWTSRLPRLPRQ
jgi:hypothetical protein